MPILRGFPPSNTISPSVRIAEKDLSFIAPAQSFHRAGIVGFASKGPINLPTLIATTRSLHATFGYPHPDVGDPYLIYAAQQYLLVSNELYVVRVGDEDAVSDEAAATAEVNIPAAGGIIDIVSQTPEQTGATWNYRFVDANNNALDSFFRWKLNGVLASKTLVVTGSTTGYTASALADELNEQLNTEVDGIEFYAYTNQLTGDNYIAVRTTWAYGPDSSLEFMSVQDSIYGEDYTGANNPTGLGSDMSVAVLTGTTDRYPSSGSAPAGAGEWIFSQDYTLEMVIDGTDNVTIDNAVQVVTIPAGAYTASTTPGYASGTAAVAAAINAQLPSPVGSGALPGGFIALANGNNLELRTLHSGRDARMLCKSDSTADTIFGLANTTQEGDSPSGVTNDASVSTFGIISGSTNVNSDVTFVITAESAGIEGNQTLVRFTNNVDEGNFNLEVYNNNIQVESWGNLTKTASSAYYVETYLTTVSEYVRCEDNTAIGAPPADGDYTLAGGSDGIPSDPDDQDTLLIGSPLDFSGMYAMSEPEQIEIDLLAVPGHSSTAVIISMLDVCENYRQDCLAIIDPPFGLTVREIVQWQNGTHPLNDVRFDSDFGALYWPWVKIYDAHNNVRMWVPPSGSILAVYANSDNLAEPWFAPAGATRGVVPNIDDVFSRPTLEERDSMYGSRNCVNPIVQFSDVEDFVVWGQKTLQRRPTALDRVNVRRLMFVIEKRVRQKSRNLLFEPHDEKFRSTFVRIATQILAEIQVGRGIYDYIIQADEELNTPDVIDRNEFRARIGVQPTKAVEFIFIEFSIHRTGSFEETTEVF